MRILVDMDGVLADFEKGFLEEWKREYPDLQYINLEDRKTFYQKDQYPRQYKDLIYGIIDRPYFYGGLEPIEGGREALREMTQLGHDVSICTSPSLSDYVGCIGGKFMWIHRHLGKDWMKKVVLTKDKTLVRGDVLIDDKPNIIGSMKPEWEQIFYDQPFNRDIIDRRRLTWRNWREVLGA